MTCRWSRIKLAVLFGAAVILGVGPRAARGQDLHPLSSSIASSRSGLLNLMERFRNCGAGNRVTSPTLEQQEITKAYRNVDPDAIPGDLREAYFSDRIFFDHLDGEWNDMLKVRDMLMKPRRSPKEDLTDADVLFTISMYFSTTSFYPPVGYPLSDDPKVNGLQAMRYWQEHWADENEAEKILQYIVDTFDPNYEVTSEALINLAFVQRSLGKSAQAFETFRRFAKTDPAQLYSVSRTSTGGISAITAGEKIANARKRIAYNLKRLPRELVVTAAGMDASAALKKFGPLRAEYGTDPEIAKLIDEKEKNIAILLSQLKDLNDAQASLDEYVKTHPNQAEAAREGKADLEVRRKALLKELNPTTESLRVKWDPKTPTVLDHESN